METNKATKKHRKYDDGFKKEALKMVFSGRSVPDVARSLGIGENLLYNWRNADKAQMSPEQSTTDVEISRLRKLLIQVETERDILKKALAIFSRQT